MIPLADPHMAIRHGNIHLVFSLSLASLVWFASSPSTLLLSSSFPKPRVASECFRMSSLNLLICSTYLFAEIDIFM